MDELEEGRPWTFFTHHAHVLISLSRDPTLRLRDIASAVGVTERATATLVSELVHAGYLLRFKDGRRNRYRVNLAGGLRHPLVEGVSVADVFAPLLPSQAPHGSVGSGSVGNGAVSNGAVSNGSALTPQRLRSAR